MEVADQMVIGIPMPPIFLPADNLLILLTGYVIQCCIHPYMTWKSLPHHPLLERPYYCHQYFYGNCSSSPQDCIGFTLRLSWISEIYCSLVHLHTSIYRTLEFFHQRLPTRNWMLPSPHKFIVCSLSYVKCEHTKGTYWLYRCTYVYTRYCQTFSQFLEKARR